LDATVAVLSPAYNTSPKLFVVILRALEAIRARPRFKDAYKAAARIGESVRKLRIKRFTSQAELSKLAGVWPAHLGRIEDNEHAPHLSIWEIARALCVDPFELVDEK
jgi:DNA-binding XRE family transcriptional regulator